MAKRTDIQKILLIGSGPIVIGQACEFDYSGTQACKALKEEGYTVVLMNSNPATIMTDPSTADRTYIEPLTVPFLEKVIALEKPDAILPTLGGQTALNLALEAFNSGLLTRYNVAMLGADAAVISKAEDRLLFKKAIEKLGLRLPHSVVAYSLEEAVESSKEIGFPCVVRPAFTLGGTGGGIAYTPEELTQIASGGLHHSLISEILIEESIIGWKEFELEVMRDRNDNVVIICSIENLDPMGVHTGDSITVAPAQTLTDVEYQQMRDAAIAIMREIGVETGGSNVQFAVNPENGDLVVIEVNPRVSRSSALASKATGFPIAKFAAKLAVGYTLDELLNDITKKTPACFEPTLDYCVVKIPRFNFQKFPESPTILGTAMKSVGETMAIGRTFKEALQKGIRSLETGRYGFGFDGKDMGGPVDNALLEKPNAERLLYIKKAISNGMSIEEIHRLTKIDTWFLAQLEQIVRFSEQIEKTPEGLRRAKEYGFSDVQLATLLSFETEVDVRAYRKLNGILPTYSLVDTCAAEFEAETPYYYSTYETETEFRRSNKDRVMILGGGPNRIGQGIEFDYCCVHASMAIRDEGLDSIMVNSNPETVSTDFDISDKLYFEPVTLEDVLHIYDIEKPLGVIVQFGGQTPLNLAKDLERAGVQLLGTSPDSIDAAEDRDRFQKILMQLGLRQPANGTATSIEEAISIADSIHYPVVVRPSYVLGGASMKIVSDQASLERYVSQARDVSSSHPILIDKYLAHAKEIDVDAISDGTDCIIAGIMEHIEEAGVHSGDSACSLPPFSLEQVILDEIRSSTAQLAKALNVVGLLNIQFAIKDNEIYVLEVNPRASRTVPFVSKATGIPWAQVATRVMLGKTIKELGVSEVSCPYYSVKEAKLPFDRFPGADVLLSPEMKSTGESMGIDNDFSIAYYKAQEAVGQTLPLSGSVFISVSDLDKSGVVPLAQELESLGFEIVSTSGTAKVLREAGLSPVEVNKVSDGGYTVMDLLQEQKIKLSFNTPTTQQHASDEVIIRQQVLLQNIPYVTTLPAMRETVKAISAVRSQSLQVTCLQDYLALLPSLSPTNS